MTTPEASALESAAALDVLVARGRCAEEEVSPGKDRLWSIVCMLVALIKSNSDYRLHDHFSSFSSTGVDTPSLAVIVSAPKGSSS